MGHKNRRHAKPAPDLPEQSQNLRLDRHVQRRSRFRDTLYTIPGMPPTLLHPPVGDAFACRNLYALAIDYEEEPPLFRISDTHYAATWLFLPTGFLRATVFFPWPQYRHLDGTDS